MIRNRNAWTIATLASCAVLVASQLLGIEVAIAPAKLTASTGFLIVAVLSGATDSAWGRALLTGLVASWVGDAILLGRSDLWFLLGLCAFLAAHVAYLTAFLLRGVHLGWAAAAAVPVMTLSTGVWIWLMPHIGGGLRLPVLVYLVIINLMVIGAIGTRGAGATWLLPAGALAFYFSDLGVATRQFMEPEFPPWVWSLPLYYAGQLMLARSPAAHTMVSRPASRSR